MRKYPISVAPAIEGIEEKQFAVDLDKVWSTKLNDWQIAFVRCFTLEDARRVQRDFVRDRVLMKVRRERKLLSADVWTRLVFRFRKGDNVPYCFLTQ